MQIPFFRFDLYLYISPLLVTHHFYRFATNNPKAPI